MATTGLGSMRNVAEQPAQSVMRAEGLQQVLGGCRRLPLPTARQVKVDVAKRHAYHTEWRPMLPNATPATQTAALPRRQTGTKRATHS